MAAARMGWGVGGSIWGSPISRRACPGRSAARAWCAGDPGPRPSSEPVAPGPGSALARKTRPRLAGTRASVPIRLHIAEFGQQSIGLGARNKIAVREVEPMTWLRGAAAIVVIALAPAAL